MHGRDDMLLGTSGVDVVMVLNFRKRIVVVV
jgi:hypothetical protein